MADLESKLTLVIADLQMQLKRAEKEVRSWKATAEKSGEGIEEKLLGERKNYLKIIDGLRRDMAVLRKEAKQGVELKADVSNYIKQLEKAHREIDGLKVAQQELAKADRLRNLGMNKRSEGIRPARNRSLNAGASNGSVALASAIPGVAPLVAAYTALNEAKEKLGQGFRFNLEMNNAAAGIANVLARFDGLNRVAAKNEAAKALKLIAELEPVTAGGLQDLTGGFMGTIAAAKGVGISTEKNILLVSKFANALANAGLPMEQLRQEMVSILSGNITSDSQLAKILGITNEEVNAIKARGGDLFSYLDAKLGVFGEAGDGANVVLSSLASAMNKFMGAATGGAFDEMIMGARDLTKVLESNQEAAKKAGLAIGDYMFVLRQYAKATDEGLREKSGSGILGTGLGVVTSFLPGGIAGPLSRAKKGLPSSEDIGQARMGEQQQLLDQQRSRQIQKIEQAMKVEGLSDSVKAEMQQRINRLKEEGYRIDQLALQIRNQENVSFAESIARATELYAEEAKALDMQKQSSNQLTAKQVEDRQKMIEAARKMATELWEEEKKLADMRRAGYMETLPLNQRIMEIQKEIATKRKEIELLPLTNEADRVRMQQELLLLTQEEVKMRHQLREQAAQTKREFIQKQEAEAEAVARASLSLAEYKEELRIQALLNDGKTKQAEMAQRDLDIQREKRRLMEQMKVSEQEALRLATERVDLERQSRNTGNGRYDSDGRRNDGRKRIVSNRDGSTKARESDGNRSGLDQFYERNNRKTRLNEEFSTPGLDAFNELNDRKTRLNEEFKTPGLDAYNEMQTRSQANAAAQDAGGRGGRDAGLAQQMLSVLQENLPQMLQALQMA